MANVINITATERAEPVAGSSETLGRSLEFLHAVLKLNAEQKAEFARQAEGLADPAGKEVARVIRAIIASEQRA